MVWAVLTDVESYGQWNPFTPHARIDFTIGSPAQLWVRMGPARMKITETVCAFEKPRLIAWSRAFGAHRLLFAVREQRLERLGESSCSYRNTDRLTGLLAPIVSMCFGRYIRPRLQRRWRGTETLCGSRVRQDENFLMFCS